MRIVRSEEGNILYFTPLISLWVKHTTMINKLTNEFAGWLDIITVSLWKYEQHKNCKKDL